MQCARADTAFADLLVSDPEWVDAEFEALIAAGFGRIEPPLPTPSSGKSPAPRRPATPAAPPTCGDLADTARRVGARERSPPVGHGPCPPTVPEGGPTHN